MSGIPFVRDLDFEYGVCQPVAPKLRRVIARNPGLFTFHGTGTYIVGEGEVAIIDPGPLIDEHIEALLSAVAGEIVTHIFITHTHSDHSPAATPIKKAVNAPTFGFGQHQPGTYWVDSDLPPSKGIDADFLPDYSLKDGETIEAAGFVFEAVHTPGHIHNHLCFSVKELDIFFSGDHVMGWSTTIVAPPDGDMRDYMDSLNKVLARNDRTYWPTHGPALTEAKKYVRALLTHRMEREVAIADALSRGSETISELVSLLYRNVPKQLHSAAGSTVLSHLVHMIQTGRVQCEGLPRENSRFGLS
ncbi:MAG: MBL fold metallo-hydrolase [Rhodospirillaceae bacterium TMED8]|nr:MBL fold metallo-hydrolase [Magnetovibrio sp.]OUT48977.1 MAG: MBL fold metallo-hydrolase [Rhodospirillaceae bacterium TMED8]|tara:strand:+ start:16 stop:921 length:906 start_codon:yes stop_codon:yes gene_type:complete